MSRTEKKPSAVDPTGDPTPRSRMQLIWDVIVFQFKLMLDGIRDVALIPISLTAALLGLVIGGNRPARYFEQVLDLGRRTEFWLNLFGHRRHQGTSDDLLRPIQEKVFDQAERSPWLNKAGTSLNRSLDKVGSRMKTAKGDDQQTPSNPPKSDRRQ